MMFYILSLKYSPGLYKEVALLADHFKSYGNTSLILSKGYKELSVNNRNIRYLNDGVGIKGMLKDLFMLPFDLRNFWCLNGKSKSEKVFIFYNPHPLNWVYALFINYFIKESSVCNVLHEPYKSNKEKLKYGLFKYFYFLIVQIAQFFSIWQSKVIITMSPNGSILFKNRFPKFKGHHISANLLFERTKIKGHFERRYFSFVGNVNKAKGIYDFIDLVNYSLSCEDNIEYCLISSSNLRDYIPLLEKGYERKLKIINRSHISDIDIYDVIEQSYAVFSIHNVAAQSGVLPIAYSLNTPSIMRDIPAFTQYKIDDNLVVPSNFTSEKIHSVCLNLMGNKNNFYTYETLCFEAFNKYFSISNFDLYYSTLNDYSFLKKE
jgi:glycosyltransferase involved in cell wall biosynthesis